MLTQHTHRLSRFLTYCLAALWLALPASSMARLPDEEKGQILDKSMEKNGVVIGDYWQYIPNSLPEGGDKPIIVLAHGSTSDAKTDARILVERWQSVAEERGLVIVAPQFDTENFDLGPWGGYRGMFGRHGRGLDARETDADGFVNNIIDKLVFLDPERFDGRIYLWGHSAGGQFVSRYIVTHPQRIASAVISASGTYAFPSMEYTWTDGQARLVSDFVWPGQTAAESRPVDWTTNPDNWLEIVNHNVTVIFGELDNEDPVPYSQGQPGQYVVDRGRAYVEAMNANAGLLGTGEGVQLIEVPGVGHNSALLFDATVPALLPFQCESFTATNSAHVTAGRAYTQTSGFWWTQTTTYYATGSGQNLGTSGTASKTLSETSEGFYEQGTCPDPIPHIVSYDFNMVGSALVITGVVEDGDGDLTEVSASGSGPVFIVCKGLEQFTCTFDGYSPGTYVYYINAEDAQGHSDQVGPIEFTIPDPDACVEHTSTNSQHVSAGRARAQTSGWWWSQTTTYYAIGSNANLGTSGTTSVTLKEQPAGYFEPGSCPTGTPPVVGNVEVSYLGEGDPQNIYGTAEDVDGDLQSVFMEIVGNRTACSGTYSWSCDLTSLAAGIYDIKIVAVDALGNEDTAGPYTVKVTRGQSKPVLINVQHGIVGNTLYIDGTASDADGDLTLVRMSVGFLLGNVCEGTTTFHCEFPMTELTPGNTYEAQVIAKDSLNQSSDPFSFQFTVPEVVPQKPVLESVQYSVVNNVLIVDGTASDADGDLESVNVSVAFYNAIECTGTSTFHCEYPLNNLTPGETYDMYVLARDATDLFSDPYVITLTIPLPQSCFTTTNQQHINAGRAELRYNILVYAIGSATYLGLPSATTSLKETGPGYWTKVTSCN